MTWTLKTEKAVKEALEFYGMLDNKVGVPVKESPAHIALELIRQEEEK